MNVETMKLLIKQGEDPIIISIKKWENILSGTGTDKGHTNCALCASYADCNICPFYYACCIDESAYDKWDTHQYEVHDERSGGDSSRYIRCDICRELAENVLEELKDLLIPGNNETEK